MGGSIAMSYCMYVLMRAAVIDFAEELLETTRLPSARGSMRCAPIPCPRENRRSSAP